MKNFSVGEPIDVQQSENPSTEEIEELHMKYVNSLKKLFDQHRLQFGLSQDVQLEII